MSDEISQNEGKIITFYSYKGGVGRTMAVANIAWILAANGKRVLVADCVEYLQVKDGRAPTLGQWGPLS